MLYRAFLVGVLFLLLACTKENEGPVILPQSETKSSPILSRPPQSRLQKGSSRTLPVPRDKLSPSLRNLPKVHSGQVRWGQEADAQGSLGVVSSVEEAATKVGVAILQKGGNAVDAAVATAFALAVTHPNAGNIGGGGFILLKLGNQVEAIDFRENSPSSLTDESFWKMIKAGGRGPASVGVPGTVAGLYLAHSRHGKLPWQEVVLPAEKLASAGYILGRRQAKTLGWAARDLRRSPLARQVFFPGGKVSKAGAMIRRPRLAQALARIRQKGPSGFYSGETAADIVSSLGKSGLLSLDDLKNYRAKIRSPLFFDFGEYRIITMPSPSAGGVALTQNLLMLQALNVANTPTDTPERLHLILETSRRSQAERQLFVVSPDELTVAGRAAQRARTLSPLTWLAQHPVDNSQATLSKSLHPSYPLAVGELQHTTHLSVVDSEGGLVSCTITLSGSFGSRIFTKQSGIVLNNSVASFSSFGANTPKPGQRTTSSMAPTLALRGPQHALVLGSPGGNTIPSTITQVFLRLALDNASLLDSVRAPRLHQGFAPQSFYGERLRPISPALRKGLRKLGHQAGLSRSTIGDANIAALADGQTFAVADRREGGLALAAQVPPRD